MKFRARLLASFVTLSLLVTLVFGVTAYRIADHSARERETRLLQQTIEQEIIVLAHARVASRTQWQAVIGSRANPNLRVFAAGSGPLASQGLPVERGMLERVDHDLREGVTAGSVRSSTGETVWAIASVTGLPYRLVAFYRPASVLSVHALGMRLAMAALLTLWITAWGGLILTGGLMKRLDTQNDAILHQALYDALTELPNRRLLFDRLQQAIALSRRHGTGVGLLVIDLDDFKAINEALGHPCGDQLLKHVAAQLRATFRGSDTVARLGSDEFALVLPQTSLDQAIACTTKAIAALETPLVFGGMTVRAEPSIGIAMFPDHGDSAEDLLRRADIAMNTAKQEKIVYAVYEPDTDARTLDRLNLIGELRTALEHGALSLYYQPKIRLSDRRVAGVEALLRWPHPTRGFVPPDQFIPLAEHTGLITVLTPWVLEQALQQAAKWKRAGTDFTVAINMSARNLRDRKLPEQVMQLLDASGLEASGITLEITETAMMADPEHALKMLKALSTIGVRLSIDDFGTGYSSLAYLQQLPVAEIKIDRSFVTEMHALDRNYSIVNATIDLAHNLGLQVVAEGVESDAVEEALRTLGCDYAQGFYFSPPLPAAKLDAWLAARHPGLAQSSSV